MEGSGSVGGDNGDKGTLPCPLTPKTRKYIAAEQKAKQLERTQRAIESQRRMEQEEHGEEVAELKRKASKAVEGKRKAVATKQEEKRRRLAAEVALEERENGVKVWT